MTYTDSTSLCDVIIALPHALYRRRMVSDAVHCRELKVIKENSGDSRVTKGSKKNSGVAKRTESI